MIKAIIFDFFGVLVTEGVTSFEEAFLNDDKDKQQQVDAMVDDLNMATLPYGDFISKLAVLAHTDERTVRQYVDANHPNRDLLDYIRINLKPKYKIGIISNAGGDYVEKMIGEQQAAMFDDIVLSHRVGVAKPDPAIYEISLSNLGVEASETVFVDDVKRFCEAADKIGIKTVNYRGFPKMKQELEDLLAPGSNN